MKRDIKPISIEEFIFKYLKVENYSEELFNNINHYDLMELNIPGVKRVPNDLVTNEDLLCGRVLLVEAKGFKHKGKMICAYIRPDIVLCEQSSNNLDNMIYNSLYKSQTPLFINKTFFIN